MSFRLVAHTPTIGAAPGESVVGRVEIFNDGTGDAVYTVTVVGLTHDSLTETADPPPTRVPVPGGSSVVTEVTVVVPRSLGIGQHAAAFEATSSRSSDRAVLTPFTVSIQSVSRVELAPQPSTIRARRKASFHLDIINNEALPVDVALTGEAPDVDVKFTPAAMSLQPGQRAVAKARLKGPRHWSGERTQHNILITARGRASSTSTTAAYVQRPLFAHRFRMILAGLTVVALWLAAIGGAALWLQNRDDGADAAPVLVGVDTDGDGIPDTFFDADGNPVTATDTDGDGIPDSFVDADGNPITGTDTNGDGIPDTLVDADGRALRAVDTNGDGTPDTLSNGAPLADPDQPTTAPEPRATILRGTVEIDGDPNTVAIALTPIELGAAPSPAASPIGLQSARPSEPEGKIWSARTTTLTDVAGTATRRTVAIEPDATVPGPDGVWLFTDVLQGQSYEVSFSSPGYDTQSFVLTPRVDGEPIDLDVVMKPANGSLSGTVVGPSGPLGGAEIRITDGTLEFTTTSASGSGTWSLSGVSTPGVYTVTATLRGFATAVRQVRLSPGDTPTGITLQMAPGLGTITGLITTNGTGLGAVTVTASNGETTLTTTTLTEGNIGFYSLPQLGVPADYTVQAELDGYVTNSRRVALGGSLAGVDFSMTSTTSTLTGRVLSSGGGGIESAGLIVSTGDLQFRASTSPTGAFEIDRLPPGDYTITAEHYQHEGATEFITLAAGGVPTPLEITLPLTSGPPAVGTGSLIVSVINEDSTIVPAGIDNARVTLSRNRSDQVFVQQDPSASAVTFANLPIGTYTINVTANGYNASAPVTRSVGLNQERAEIRLQKLGQASGIMVDSLDRTMTPISGYSVTLYRLLNDSDTVGIPIGTYGANAAGTWMTPPAALATGVYRLEATSPSGFLVRNDQVLDTSPEVRGRPMSFLVPTVTDAEVTAIPIPAIQADPYPTITGKIYKPRLNGVTVEYDALDDASLTVTGTCNGRTVDPSRISITDEFGPTGGGPDLFDTFSLTKETVAEVIPTGELPGTCEFTVEASSRIDAEITLTNIVPSDGATASDRLAAAALVRTPESLTGTVFWFDTGTPPTGTREPLGNVAIAASAPVITGFASTERTTILPDPRPVPVLAPSSTTSAATSGAWTLTGQVFGTASYQFTAANFTPGAVPVTINETTRVVPATGTNVNVFTDPSIDGAGYGIELRPPNPGSISGRVTIQTSVTPKYGTDMVRATDPTGSPRTRTPNATGDFTFADAIAGTWTIDFDDLPNHVREPAGEPPPAEFREQLLPGGTITDVDATYTELATVRVRLFDKTSEAAITPSAGLTLTAPASAELTGPVPDRSEAPPVDGYYSLAGIPVARTTPPANPATVPVDYRLAVQLDGYDLSLAQTGPAATDPVVDARDIAVPLVAGRVTEIDLYVDSFKEITGSIVGLQTSGAALDLPLSGPAALDVQFIGAGETDFETTAGSTPGSFVVTGRPGVYLLTPSHPEYQDFPTQVVVLGASTGTPVGPYQLTLRTSRLSVDALTRLTGGADVDGAVFDRYLGTAPCGGFPGTAVRETIPLAGPRVIDIAPGTYCLRISKFDDTEPTPIEIAFPAIVAVTVPNSTAASVSVATVVAPLPALKTSLTGRLVAQNTNPTPGVVELIAAPGLELTSTFETNVDVSVDGVDESNLNPDTGDRTSDSVVQSTSCTSAADCFWTYTFESIPLGLHEITAPAIPGYTLQSATLNAEITTFGPSDDGPTFVYTVANAPVEIDLGTGAYPSLDPAFPDPKSAVTLTSPSGATASTYTFEKRGNSNILVMSSVAPEIGNYTLAFNDALHGVINPANAAPGAVSLTVTVALPLVTVGEQPRRIGTAGSLPTPSLVRLYGTAQQRTGTSTLIDLETGATMTLAGGGNTYTITAGTPGATSLRAVLSGDDYWFDVPANANYSLTVSQTGYFSTEISPLAVTPLGSAVAQNVEIDKAAVVTVTVIRQNNLPAPPGLRVTLVNKATGAVEQPRPGTTIFDVRAGIYYASAVADSPYPPQVSADTTVTIGDTTRNVNLALPRYVRVRVTGPPTTPVPATATVTLTGGTPLPLPVTEVFQFVNPTLPTAPATLEATASAPGFRTRRVQIPNAIVNEPPVSVALAATVTVSGDIAAPNGPIEAVNAANSSDTRTGEITDGSYVISGLDNNTDGSSKTWNISYDVLGAGVGSAAAVVVSSVSPSAVVDNDITLDVRDVTYDFSVTTPIVPTPSNGPTTSNVGAAQVAILDNAGATISSASTIGNGTQTVTVDENTRPTTWRVSHPDHLTRSGPVGALTAARNEDLAVLLQPAVTGTVLDSAPTPAPVGSASIVVCPVASLAPCTPVEPDRSTSTSALGAFRLNSGLPASSSHRVWASTATQRGSVVLTIDAAGRGTLTPSNNITISTPPP